MSKQYLLSIFAASITFAIHGSPAIADSIPWGYSAGNAEIFNNNNSSLLSSVKFAGASGVATGSSGIIIYSLTASSSASDSSPDSFANVPFDLAFTLTDIKATGSVSGASKTSEVIHFSGLFSANNVTKQSLLPDTTLWSSPVKAQAVLGGDDVGWRTYSVLLSSFTSPGQPGGSPGSIQAIVTLDSTTGPIEIDEEPRGNGESLPPTATPEPASGVLAGLGLLSLIAVWRTRRRRRSRTVNDFRHA